MNLVLIVQFYKADHSVYTDRQTGGHCQKDWASDPDQEFIFFIYVL